ncbi:MAG TPA: hypothetical protein VGD53_28570 [Actinoallomurus sp.]|jgi:hypothetical protein
MSIEPESRTLRVELDLVVGAEPIRGRIRDHVGVETAFSGWLELMQLVDRVRSTR